MTHLIGVAVAIAATPTQVDPFAQLRAAYAARDAAAAAATYTPDAVVTYRYEGTPEERHVGTAAVARSFRTLFDQIDPKQRLDLNFRTTDRQGNRAAGVYRLRVGSMTSFGRFAVALTPGGRFASDSSTSATLADFENAPGPVMLAADNEVLDRRYYTQLAGRYRMPDRCEVVVTRSVARLFARNSCTGDWRGLTRVSGLEWTAGNRVLSDKRVTTYRFAPAVDGVSPSLRITDAAGTKVAERRHAYRTEDVAFTSADGTKLAGTLYLPFDRRDRRPASVMIHGSGPQDRDGYASIIAVMADELAANGRAVLAYDKRGSGGSGGDGARAGFDRLADDAMAGMTLLRQRPEIAPAKVGLAGSSQAGWVAARAIGRGAKPADVLLIGAAGTALTVAEQNLYNTEVRMRCAGIKDADVKLALAQQRAFFAFRSDPQKAATLDRLTTEARTRPALADWLFPDSRIIDRSAGAWYTGLEPRFDPLPVWRGYRGNALFLFGEHDDSTPTRQAIARLASAPAVIRVIPTAQHLGLAAHGKCNAELSDVAAFAPGMMQAISGFALAKDR